MKKPKGLLIPVKTIVFSCLFMAFTTRSVFADIDMKKFENTSISINWVAYSPTNADPTKKIEATFESIREDLKVLQTAGFTGIVTYASNGILGDSLIEIAKMEGFQGIIMGVWDPNNMEEIKKAQMASSNPIVLGFCVGNEGLNERYKLEKLSEAIQNLRQKTTKPVTTTQQIDDYSDKKLLELGDWVFPNAHPFFHDHLEPMDAVVWTKTAYDDLKRRTNRFVLIKEVGLPTAGDQQNKMSEEYQKTYYLELAKTDVKFVYFEAFDQTWKTHLPIEPHWGLFKADRSPKLLVKNKFNDKLESTAKGESFYVYLDADYPNNHFKPTGYMGDCGDIHVIEAFDENPHSGTTCIRIVYEAKGKGPNECSYPAPCKWAGVYWQQPPGNWGKDASGKGHDLSAYNCLLFWAKADKECRIEFKVGGISGPYGDSLEYARSKTAKLTPTWTLYEIDLKGADLENIIGGFCFATNWDNNPSGATFYLDDIRFEKK
jgi:exo-beta-1,3-glucanase (GH17 family)